MFVLPLLFNTLQTNADADIHLVLNVFNSGLRRHGVGWRSWCRAKAGGKQRHGFDPLLQVIDYFPVGAFHNNSLGLVLQLLMLQKSTLHPLPINDRRAPHKRSKVGQAAIMAAINWMTKRKSKDQIKVKPLELMQRANMLKESSIPETRSTRIVLHSLV